MRIETTTTHETVARPRPKVWLSADDYEQLLEHVDYRGAIVIRLGAEVGLRSFEIPQIRPRDLDPYRTDDGERYFLYAERGKDTTGHDGKARDAYLPRDLHRDLQRYITENNIAPSDPIIDISPRTVQRIVKHAAESAADATGDDDFRLVSSHDLRRYFAHRALVKERMNPRVVMDVGGWDDYKSLEPYLSKPDEETIISEFSRAGRD